MPKVSLPSGDWAAVVYVLEQAQAQGFLVGPLLTDINRQLDQQEN